MAKYFRIMRFDWPLHFILLFTNWLPDNTPFLYLRGALVTPFFGKVGKNLRLGRNNTFYNPSSIHFGSDVYIAHNCILLAIGNIIIEDEVIIGPSVVISAGNHVKRGASYRFGFPEVLTVFIGRGTWVGANSTINGGAVIEEGCLIASNSAVTQGIVPANTFAAGVPARAKPKSSSL